MGSRRAAVLDVEGDLEDTMDNAGEHQGGAVDVRTRAGVKEWNWEFAVKPAG
jgi:hypothetical protein